MRRAELQRNAVVLACAVSAGIHGALVKEHFEEGAGAGLGFALATAALAVLAVVVPRRPSERAFAWTAAVFAGLIAAYGLAVTTGVPLLHPEREPVDGLALFTKGVEAVGLLAAVALARRRLALALPRLKGTPI